MSDEVDIQQRIEEREWRKKQEKLKKVKIEKEQGELIKYQNLK